MPNNRKKQKHRGFNRHKVLVNQIYLGNCPTNQVSYYWKYRKKTLKKKKVIRLRVIMKSTKKRREYLQALNVNEARDVLFSKSQTLNKICKDPVEKVIMSTVYPEGDYIGTD